MGKAAWVALESAAIMTKFRCVLLCRTASVVLESVAMTTKLRCVLVSRVGWVGFRASSHNDKSFTPKSRFIYIEAVSLMEET